MRSRGWTEDNIDSISYAHDNTWEADDDDFNHIENGDYLSITSDSSGSASFYQEIFYTGSITEKLQGQITYKLLGGASAGNARMFIRVYDENDTSVLYVYVGDSLTETDEWVCSRWILPDSSMQTLSGVTVSKIRVGVYFANLTGTMAIGINHVLLTFGNTQLPKFSWTNSASKDLISQINMSPTGLKIRGDKISIDTHTLNLTFGSQASSVTIQSTTDNDGVLFTGNGKVHFETSGEFDVQNKNSSSIVTNQFKLANASTYATLELYNRNSSAQDMNFIKLNHYPSSNWNRLLFQNNYVSGTTANWVQTSCANQVSDFQFYNYHYNGNLANTFYMTTSSNDGRLEITNRKSDGTVRTGIYMNANGGLTIETKTGGTSSIKVPGTGESGTGNLGINANNDLVLNCGGRLCIDSSKYGTGGGLPSGVTPTTGDNVTLRNWNNTQNCTLYFYKGIFLGYTLSSV